YSHLREGGHLGALGTTRRHTERHRRLRHSYRGNGGINQQPDDGRGPPPWRPRASARHQARVGGTGRLDPPFHVSLSEGATGLYPQTALLGVPSVTGEAVRGLPRTGCHSRLATCRKRPGGPAGQRNWHSRDHRLQGHPQDEILVCPEERLLRFRQRPCFPREPMVQFVPVHDWTATPHGEHLDHPPV
ncbi:unnamed protein product, partial [Ectocarpus sp. 4 AP-2014]